MGKEWIQRYESKEYLNAFDVSSIKSNGKYKFFPLVVRNTKLQLIPLRSINDRIGKTNNDDLVITNELLNVIKDILSNIREYDECVQRYTHLESNFDFSLSIIYFSDEEVHLDYWGNSYNTQWSAILNKSKQDQWFISDWG